MCTQIARWHELHVSTTVMRYSHDFNLSRRQKRDASAAACSLLGWQFSDDAGACWCRLQTLGKMQASDELTDAQVRQLLFDLDSSYQAFNQLLHSTWTIEQQRTCVTSFSLNHFRFKSWFNANTATLVLCTLFYAYWSIYLLSYFFGRVFLCRSC